MKHISILIFCAFLYACSNTPSANTPQTNEAIFIIFENGGTVAENEQEDSMNVILNLLHQLSKLGRRHATRNTQVYIILSALPNRVSWSGTPNQLIEQCVDIKNLLVFKPSFSDLVVAFDQIETTIKLTQPDNVKLYWIGSCVNVPFRSIDSKTPITVRVPQEIPNLALANFVDRLHTLRVYQCHPDQEEMMRAYLEPLGILKRAKAGDIDFALLGAAQTKSKINDLL